MKTLFISLAAMCILFSQNNSAFGLRTSLNMTSYNGNDLLDMGVTTGFAAGAWYSHPLSENWSVLAELNISFRGGLGIGPAVDTLGYNITAELEDKLTFLEIPVSFILKSSDNVWFGVGP
ncbi:MAG: outer membrane beta-barrel protein, partial [Calditrichaeota bacterium]|nr:outer membrane beta-barrel protein [Calditrichota bacterium]